MTTKKPRGKREEMSLKQKTYIGIGLLIFSLILIFKVGIPQYALMQGRRMADKINTVITTDHFELMDAERKGVQFFSSFQSTLYKDLVISTDIPPDKFEVNSIRFLYERALAQKSGTIGRFEMATSDTLYDALKPVLGDRLLRVMGEFGAQAPAELELDQPFTLGELRSWTPTVDIQDTPTDEAYLHYLELVLKELAKKDYGYVGVNLSLTPDRTSQTTYSLEDVSPGSAALVLARQKLAERAAGGQVLGFSVQTGTYYDYPYNHNYTLPEGK